MSSSSEAQDVGLMMGQIIGHSYNPGYIVLSYLVSLIGCWTALELLHKRTSTRGPYNWYLLLAAAMSTGAVAIWSMHFVGNRAIQIANGHESLQIVYNPGFTAGSFFLPMCVVGVAFYFFSISEAVTVLKTAIGGVLTGFGVCAMHYMGQRGIANYTPCYDWRYILGSVIISVVASTVALGVFFYFKSTWTDSWWKRISCAATLALAISGMHWLATAGTSYRLRSMIGATRSGLSRQATVIVVLCLAISCCASLVAFAFIGQRNRQRSADRAQQVVLASATFDTEGRLMVTPDGLLPSRKITNSYNNRALDEVFDLNHPVFCWTFRASRCWKGIVDLVPVMRSHLRTSNVIKPSHSTSFSSESGYPLSATPPRSSDYGTIFKELFCITASELADTFQESLESLGVLFEDIMNTGTTEQCKRKKLFRKGAFEDGLDEAERGRHVRSLELFGRGQLLFLVRQVNKSEASRLQAVGFRFAHATNVIESLARSMQVPRETLSIRLDRMRGYFPKNYPLEPGTYLGCFALRPVYQQGFEVLVLKDAKYLMPTEPLEVRKLERWHLRLLAEMENWTVVTCCEHLRGRTSTGSREERMFTQALLDGITRLAFQIGHPFFEEARLITTPFCLPGSTRGAQQGHQGQKETQLIAFRIITDAHQARCFNRELEYIPSRFFLCQQRVYKNSPDNEIFCRKLHQDFATTPTPSPSDSNTVPTLSPRPSFYRQPPNAYFSWARRASASPSERRRWALPFSSRYGGDGSTTTRHGSQSSEKSLTGGSPERAAAAAGQIHVSNEIRVNISEVPGSVTTLDSEVEMACLGTRSEVGTGTEEQETFADRLMALTMEERRNQRR